MRFFALFLLMVLTIQTSSAATIFVDPSSNGDEVINAAMQQTQPGDIVHLKTGTFWVDDTIDLAGGVTLTGDGEIKLADNVGWEAGKTMFSASGIDDITITNITIDGNSQGNTDVPFGKGYCALFGFQHCNNVLFDGVTLEYAKSDGIIFRNGKNITVKNCTINKMGHEGLYSLYSDYVTFSNNNVFTRTNSACRISSGAHVLISQNEVYSGSITATDGGGSSTGPGFEIDLDGSSEYAYDIEICNNYIHNLEGSAIWMTSANDNGQGVYIHNNIIRDVGQYRYDNKYSTAGITIFQFNATLIENNVFDDTGLAGVRHAQSINSAISGTFSTIVRNNIFINIRDKITIASEPIMNTYSKNHYFYVYNNDFYNNLDTFNGEAYFAQNNYALNPMFADSMYHLQDDSPLIGAGYNGTDIGAYGTGSDEIGTIEIIDHDKNDDSGASNERTKEPTDDLNEDVDNSTYDEPNHDLDNVTIDDGRISDEDELNHDLDNSTTDYIENSTIDYVDNSTMDYIDNSTAEHHRSNRRGTGYALLVTPQEEIMVCSAELTKPTFRRTIT